MKKLYYLMFGWLISRMRAWVLTQFILTYGPDTATTISQDPTFEKMLVEAMSNYYQQRLELLPHRYNHIVDLLIGENLITVAEVGGHRNVMFQNGVNDFMSADKPDNKNLMVSELLWITNDSILQSAPEKLQSRINEFMSDLNAVMSDGKKFMLALDVLIVLQSSQRKPEGA